MSINTTTTRPLETSGKGAVWAWVWIGVGVGVRVNSGPADSTFQFNRAFGFCGFGAQWRNGPRYTLTPCGIFCPNEAMDRT